MRSLETFAITRNVLLGENAPAFPAQNLPSTHLLTTLSAYLNLQSEEDGGRPSIWSPQGADEHRCSGERTNLQLHYQPIVRSADHVVIGAEALLRWHDDAGRSASPNEVLRAATILGRCHQLDELILDRALAEIISVLAAVGDPDPYVGVNVSPAVLAHEGFLCRVQSRLDQLQIDPSGLVIEVPDQARVLVDPRTKRTISGLQDLGILICLDDAGPGGGVLATVRHLDIDTVKISRNMVAQIHKPNVADSVGNLVNLARRQGTRVIAVGISTRSQARQLRLLGCDFLQGHHFGEAIDREQFLSRVS